MHSSLLSLLLVSSALSVASDPKHAKKDIFYCSTYYTSTVTLTVTAYTTTVLPIQSVSTTTDFLKTSQSSSNPTSPVDSALSSSLSYSSSSAPTSNYPAASGCTYWLENIQHQGISAFNLDSSYEVYRNVKDYGAKGDGVTDDTSAINAAIRGGNRCGPGFCGSTSTTPALIYFPAGTYLVSGSIIDYYQTQLVGNPNCLPIIKANPNFTDAWIIDGDQYQSSGAPGWLSTNLFWRQIRNFVIDTTAVDPLKNIRAIHWPSAQASSLQNIVFQLSADPGTQHEGVFIENGSGGLMIDLIFYGGLYGVDLGSQQFTLRNLTFYNCATAINQIWDWGWTYQGISINNCGTGINLSTMSNGVHSVGSVILIDSIISNTLVGIKTVNDGSTMAGTFSYPNLILENVNFDNVPIIIQNNNTASILIPGSYGETSIEAWVHGHAYTPTGPNSFQGSITPNSRNLELLSPNGQFFTYSKPHYSTYTVADFLSARTAGARGDGQTDDTAILQAALEKAVENGQVLFVDAGTYKLTETLYIPAGSKIVGESYSVLMASGSYFQDVNNPQPVVQVGKPGEVGRVEWSDMIVSTQGATSGAILIEWNLAALSGSPSGMWDVHTRIGGTAGTKLQTDTCQKNPSQNLANPACIAAFMAMHMTSSACGLYMENNWFWVADHDVDGSNLTQISVYAGRGLLIESHSANIWMYATAAEHHTLYQYQLANVAGPVFMGFLQTESPYYQPNPLPPTPFNSLEAYNDPIFVPGTNNTSSWGFSVLNSSQVLVYGAGLYSFFNNYNASCSNQGNGEWCQEQILSVENASLSIYGLQTVGIKKMITIDDADDAAHSDNLNGFADSIAVFRSV